MCQVMNKRHGRCCCMFTCLAASAGLALLFLGVFLVLLGLWQSSAHDALRVSGCALAGSGAGLLLMSGAALLWPGGRGELHECCLQHGSRGTQVGADTSSMSSGDSYYDPPQLRVIPPTPFGAESVGQPDERRPDTAPEFILPR